jgi:hypothetical protein
MNDTLRASIGAVLGASAAGLGATAAAPESGPALAVSLAGVGGALGAGLHQLGRAITAWVEADAAMRREVAAQLVEVRELVRDVRELIDRAPRA